MVWEMGFKAGKLPQVHLMCGLIFPDNLSYTGYIIFEHSLVIFAWLISHFILTAIIILYSHCYQLFDALICLLVVGNYILRIWNILVPLPPVCFWPFFTTENPFEYALSNFDSYFTLLLSLLEHIELLSMVWYLFFVCYYFLLFMILYLFNIHQ